MVAKKKPIFFAIITPSYNQAVFLPQTILSVTSQITPHDFYFVADGGSRDGSRLILRQHARSLQYVSEADKGQANAINKGIRQLNSWMTKNHIPPEKVIFAYLNSDDYYLPQALKWVKEQFRLHPQSHWLVGDCQIVNVKNRSIQKPIQWYKKIWRQIISWPILLVLNPLPQPAIFIRGDVLREVGIFNESLHYTMDYEYWLRVWQKFGPPLVTNKTLAAFRIHQTSKGSLGYAQQFKEQLQVAHRFCQNPAWLFLQKLHNRLIILSYQIIK